MASKSDPLVSSLQPPVSSHQPPVSSHQFPATSSQQPVPSHQSPASSPQAGTGWLGAATSCLLAGDWRLVIGDWWLEARGHVLFHWQFRNPLAVGNWLVAWVGAGDWTGDWWLKARRQGLGWLVRWVVHLSMLSIGYESIGFHIGLKYMASKSDPS